MLKLLFTGGGFAGFILAVALGFGYNPLSGPGGGSFTTTAPQTSAASPKAELGADKPAIAATAAGPAAVAAAEPVPSPTAAPAFDPSQIAQSLQSLAPNSTDTAAAAATSSDDLTGLLNQFTSLLGGDNSKGGSGDFNLNELMKLLGNGR